MGWTAFPKVVVGLESNLLVSVCFALVTLGSPSHFAKGTITSNLQHHARSSKNRLEGKLWVLAVHCPLFRIVNTGLAPFAVVWTFPIGRLFPNQNMLD